MKRNSLSSRRPFHITRMFVNLTEVASKVLAAVIRCMLTPSATYLGRAWRGWVGPPLRKGISYSVHFAELA